jgi:hypothetical protein
MSLLPGRLILVVENNDYNEREKMNEAQVELFSMLVEDAGMTIGYWAEQARHSESKQTYQVSVQDEFVEDYPSKTLTYQDLLDASKKIASGEVKVNSQTKSVCQAIVSDPSDVDYDADDADVIVQVAMFGEIVFG